MSVEEELQFARAAEAPAGQQVGAAATGDTTLTLKKPSKERRRPSRLAIERPKPLLGHGKVEWLGLGLRLGEKLGRGSYAVVYRVDRPRADGGEDSAATKVTATEGDEYIKLQARQEYDILKHISHPNIIRAHVFEEAAKEVAMIMDYIPGGSLAS